jgi:hypothetical protein
VFFEKKGRVKNLPIGIAALVRQGGGGDGGAGNSSSSGAIEGPCGAGTSSSSDGAVTVTGYDSETSSSTMRMHPT